jgi:hypothetical protein
MVADNRDAQGGTAYALNEQRQVNDVADPARHFEITFDVNEGKCVLTAHNKLGIVVTKLLRVPIFD